MGNPEQDSVSSYSEPCPTCWDFVSFNGSELTGGAGNNEPHNIMNSTPQAGIDLDTFDVSSLVKVGDTLNVMVLKYDRETLPIATDAFSIDLSGYRIAGCYPLTEDYFRWSGADAGGRANTADLMGGAACPHCGNPITVALCGCGKLMCLRGPGEATCPWCREDLRFAPSAGQGFDVERRQG